jgi:hypothetical protein
MPGPSPRHGSTPRLRYIDSMSSIGTFSDPRTHTPRTPAGMAAGYSAGFAGPGVHRSYSEVPELPSHMGDAFGTYPSGVQGVHGRGQREGVGIPCRYRCASAKYYGRQTRP